MKIGFVSLGCPKNLVDTEVMMGLLAARGHVVTNDPSDAEAIVVNTCSFVGDARQESVDAILEMAEFKRSGSARRLVVAGCLVERYPGEIQESLPEVDAVVGTNQVEAIVAACEGGAVPTGPAKPYLYHHLTPRLLSTPRHYAYIKIAEGCDHQCSFCVIPQFRGRFRSRRPESVVAEAAALLDQGVREINLVGQDTTSYGEDLGLKDGLADLLERLARIPLQSNYWVRFLYAYPNRITTKLLDTLAAQDRLVKYLDMPLQHASAAVLRRMKRGSSGDHFLRLIEKIRRHVPGIALRTSMIVGFPGETDSAFDELCRFVESARFDNLGVFCYSDEETSRSFRLDGKISRQTAHRRRRRLMSIQQKIARAANRARIGQETFALVEGPSSETELLWQARTPGQAPEIDGVCLVNDVEGGVLRAGQIRRFRVTAAAGYDLIGTILGDDEVPRTDLLPVLGQARK